MKFPTLTNRIPDKRLDKAEPKLHTLWVLLPVTIACGLYALSNFLFHHLADPLEDGVGPDAEEFIELYARNNLKKLNDIGPRLVGSEANEILAINFLTNAVEEIKSKSLSKYTIEYEVQTATYGSYIIDDMVDVYRDIKNFVVRFTSVNQESNSSLLVNSHFDTVPESSGAGDDGTMVVVMLEILRVLSITSQTLKYPVIFLFNGAEENSMQGSHAFITQHRWAKDVKAFINLDVAGIGGKEMLFQSVPGHSWLVKHYGRSATYPYASTLAEEVFQNGLVPSDTDYRVFSSYAGIPGLDIAQSYNGYVYHSKLDRFSAMTEYGSLQNTGENMLDLIKSIASSKELEDPSEYSEGHTVFYDFLGMFFISYSENVGIAINISIAVISLTAIGLSIWAMHRRLNLSMSYLLKKFAIIFAIQLATVVLAIGIIVIMAVVIDAANASMFWFTNNWLIFGVYLCPYCFIMAIVPAIFLSWRERDIPLRYGIQLFLHSYCVFLIIIVIAMTSAGIRSAFVVTFGVVFYTLSMIINWAGRLQKRAFLWLIPLLILQMIPFQFYLYLSHIIYSTFLPITGRSGCTSSPELLIVAFSIIIALLTTGFLAPLFSTIRKSKTIISGFMLIFIVFAIMLATHLAFPFTKEIAARRQWIFHTERTSYDINGIQTRKDSGFVLLPLDRRSPEIITDLLSSMSYRKTGDDCSDMLVCGVPVYASNFKFLSNYSYWVPSQPPVIPEEYSPQIKLLRKTTTNQTTIRYDIEISGPAHLQVFLNPINQSQLVDWSVTKGFPKKDYFQESLYFLHFRHGRASKAFQFYLEFEIPKLYGGAVFDMALVAHHNNYPIIHTQEFTDFLNKFPEWVTLTPIVSSYISLRL